MLQQLNMGGKILTLDEPKIMGILNATPDSFYDGGRHHQASKALQQVEKMLANGADIIDVGGMSSRPGAKIIDVKEEKSRVVPIIQSIQKHFPEAFISIDTIRSEVARAAIGEGASVVNDISAGKLDDLMYKTVGELKVPYVLMHMQGKPETMQENPNYKDIGLEVLDFFIQEIKLLREQGVKDIILDPGFGFGKTIEHNYQLLKNLRDFLYLECPLLAGLSRKSMIYKVLEVEPEEALNGTTALHMAALMKGAKMLRVHDVKEAKECICLYQMMNGA